LQTKKYFAKLISYWALFALAFNLLICFLLFKLDCEHRSFGQIGVWGGVPWSKVDMHLDSACFNCDKQKYKFYEGLIYISRRSSLPKDPAQRLAVTCSLNYKFTYFSSGYILQRCSKLVLHQLTLINLHLIIIGEYKYEIWCFRLLLTTQYYWLTENVSTISVWPS